MRISDWSSDVCSSDLLWNRFSRKSCLAAARLRPHGKTISPRTFAADPAAYPRCASLADRTGTNGTDRPDTASSLVENEAQSSRPPPHDDHHPSPRGAPHAVHATARPSTTETNHV